MKGAVLWLTKEYREALAAAETEVALDPNSAYGYAAIGRVEGLLGRCEPSIAHIKQAFALSPRDPLSGIWYGYLGIAEFCRGRLDAAIEQRRRGETGSGGGASSQSSTHDQMAYDRDAVPIDRYRWLAQGRTAGRMSARRSSAEGGDAAATDASDIGPLRVNRVG